MSYTTVDSVALFLNRDIDSLNDMELAQIEITIKYIDGVINNYCGWNMNATTYTDKRFDGSGTNTLDLRLSPVNSLTQVRVRALDGIFTDVTGGIEILDDGLIQFLPYADSEVTTFTAGVKNWYVSFNAGFPDNSIPNELAYAASLLTTIHFNKVIDENLGEEEEKFGEATFKNTSVAIPPPVARILDRFRMVSIF